MLKKAMNAMETNDLVQCKNGYLGAPEMWHGKVAFSYFDAKNGKAVDIDDLTIGKAGVIGKDLGCSKATISDLKFHVKTIQFRMGKITPEELHARS